MCLCFSSIPIMFIVQCCLFFRWLTNVLYRQNIARIAKAALPKLPGKSTPNVRSVCPLWLVSPVCPVCPGSVLMTITTLMTTTTMRTMMTISTTMTIVFLRKLDVVHHLDGLAFCKWSSGLNNLLQMIICIDQPLANDPSFLSLLSFSVIFIHKNMD